MDDFIIRVLIVDDHKMVRNGLKMLLDSLPNCELVGEAANGEEAVQFCEHLAPDVVLMDIVMPGMDGITATQIIRENQPDTQIIVLSSFCEDGNIKAALAAGAFSFLPKSVTVDELSDALYASVRA